MVNLHIYVCMSGLLVLLLYYNHEEANLHVDRPFVVLLL